MTTRAKPGAPPGTLIQAPEHSPVRLRVLSYTEEAFDECEVAGVEQLRSAIRPGWVNWVSVIGLGDPARLAAVGQLFNLHPLALEDVIDTHQRPKVERYDNALFLILRTPRLAERVESEQVSLFLLDGVVLSFEEREGEVLEWIRNRIRTRLGRIRTRGADYLAYALIDAAIDSYFPVLEALGERVDALEDDLIDRPSKSQVRVLHENKRDFFHLRRAMWPMREAIAALIRDDNPLLTADTRVYLRDCADHAIRIVDLVETGREICSDLMDVYVSSMSNRLNQVMKVLTIISTIFIPLTFLAGVYGMNFNPGSGPLSMPELSWPLGYLGFWVVSGIIAIGLLSLFWRLGWLRRDGVD